MNFSKSTSCLIFSPLYCHVQLHINNFRLMSNTNLEVYKLYHTYFHGSNLFSIFYYLRSLATKTCFRCQKSHNCLSSRKLTCLDSLPMS